MQSLPGFRDFYPDDCARRNYILTKWREVARRYGFVEYDGPVLEPIDLYKKKSGGELVGQLFDFVDKGERHVAMRPEMTPTLARMVAARERDFKKPLKWFCVPQFFRYEKQQRGRLREFYQLNCDIIGEPSPAADAELVAVLIDTLRSFGLTDRDFVVRLSDRDVWTKALEGFGLDEQRSLEYLNAIPDKVGRIPEEEIKRRSESFGVPWSDVEWLSKPAMGGVHYISEKLGKVYDNLKARGLESYLLVDPSIVRGLAYYTGVVFEVFDRSKNERALAGGGRYDKLLSLMSDGKVDLPSLGFGMGDVVLANLIDDTPAAKEKMDAWLKQERACDVYVVVANEDRRSEALSVVQQLREAGQRVDFALTAAKVGKQFQTAEQLGATRAVLVGDEWPQVKVKTLATREELLVPLEELTSILNSEGSLRT